MQERAHQSPTREVPQREILDVHWAATKLACDGRDAPTFLGEMLDALPEFLEVVDLCDQGIFWIFTHASTSREENTDWELKNFLQGGDDFPNVVIDSEGSFFTAHK